MTQTEALITLALLGLAAMAVSRRYLPRDLQLLVAAVGLIGSASTLLGQSR